MPDSRSYRARVFFRRWWVCIIRPTTYQGRPCWTEYRICARPPAGWRNRWYGWMTRWTFDPTTDRGN